LLALGGRKVSPGLHKLLFSPSSLLIILLIIKLPVDYSLEDLPRNGFEDTPYLLGSPYKIHYTSWVHNVIT
jgi:hypothetical protein